MVNSDIRRDLTAWNPTGFFLERNLSQKMIGELFNVCPIPEAGLELSFKLS